MAMPNYANVRVKVTDGNREAFRLLGSLESALRAAGLGEEEIARVMGRATAGDYINLLRTVAQVAEVE